VSDSVDALRFLLARSFANRVRVELRRARSPRYAVAIIIGALWLWTFMGNGVRNSGAVPAGFGDAVQNVYELLIALTTAWLWLFGAPEPALTFSRAEVQSLFPAPLSRRALINYKLAQAQIAILLSVLIWKVLLSRSVTGIPFRHAMALWVLFTALYLHRVGASFVRVSAAQHGRAGLRRNVVPLTIAATAIGLTIWTVWRSVPALSTALASGAMGPALRALRNEPVIRVVFWPFHALIAPVFARTADEWADGIGWALLILAACYVWVVRTGVSFEEAAMQRSERLAAQRAARRTRGDVTLRASRIWPPLPPKGRPAAAIAWKVVVAFQRFVPLTRAALFALLFIGVILLSMPGVRFGVQLLGTGMLVAAGLLAIMGPLFTRTDLQQDMLMLPLLRTYPLSGRTIVAAEIAGTVAVLSAAQLALVVAGFALLAPWAAQWLRDAAPSRALSEVPVIISVLLVTPAVTALRVAVANAWAVLLPGWVHLGPGRSGGIESLGQNLLSVMGSMFVHLLLLVLPALSAAMVYWVLRGIAGPAAYIPAALVGTAAAGAELWFIVEWLGAVLARTDPAVVEAATAS
jgi:hypothetical protein